jgi:hypothetical protein
MDVIRKVSPLLHTPMSLTNAISRYSTSAPSSSAVAALLRKAAWACGRRHALSRP